MTAVLKSLFKILVLFLEKYVGEKSLRRTQIALYNSLQLLTYFRISVVLQCYINTSSSSIGSY
jgi:hypothetical protein